MFLAELKTWYAWILYAVVLNVAAFVAYYRNPTPAPAVAAIEFQFEKQLWEPDRHDYVIVVRCDRRQSDPAQELKVRFDLEGNLAAGVRRDVTVVIKPNQNRGEHRLRRSDLASETGNVLALLRRQPPHYEVADVKQHTVIVGPPAIVVGFDESTDIKLSNADDFGELTIRRRRGPDDAVEVLLDVRQPESRLEIPPKVMLGKGERQKRVSFPVQRKSGATNVYAAVVTLKTSAKADYQVDGPDQVKITVDPGLVSPVVKAISASASRLRRGFGQEWTLTAELTGAAASRVELTVDLVRGTAVRGKDYDAAFPQMLTIPPGERIGKLVVPLLAGADLQPDGLDLVVSVSPRGAVEVPGGKQVFTLHIDDDTEGELALVVLMTKRAQEDWEKLASELNRVQKNAKLFKNLLGGRVFFVNADRELLPWRIGTPAAPILSPKAKLFEHNLPINDYFKPAMDGVSEVAAKAKVKSFAAYVIYASPKDPNESAALGAGQFAAIKKTDRPTYVAWISDSEHPAITAPNKLPREHWLLKNFGDTGLNKGSGVRLFNRAELDGATSFAAELQGHLLEIARWASKK